MKFKLTGITEEQISELVKEAMLKERISGWRVVKIWTLRWAPATFNSPAHWKAFDPFRPKNNSDFDARKIDVIQDFNNKENADIFAEKLNNSSLLVTNPGEKNTNNYKNYKFTEKVRNIEVSGPKFVVIPYNEDFKSMPPIDTKINRPNITQTVDKLAAMPKNKRQQAAKDRVAKIKARKFDRRYENLKTKDSKFKMFIKEEISKAVYNFISQSLDVLFKKWVEFGKITEEEFIKIIKKKYNI